MPNEIIVGVDPHHEETGPIALGAALGRTAGVTLRIVAVYADPTGPFALAKDVRDEQAREHALGEVRAKLDDVGASGSELDGVPFRLEAIASSSPARVLHELAERQPDTLLVVGSTHRGALGRVLTGSTAEKVVHGSPVPVAVAPRGYRAPQSRLSRIGVAYAGTDEGRQALQSAALVAERAGARLEAMTVVDPVVYPSVPPIEASAEQIGELKERAEADLRRRLHELRTAVDAEVTVFGHDGLAQLIDRTGELDLLVCGSRGYGPRAAVLLGGVTHELIQKAHCPLLVIPRGVEHALEPLLSRESATA